MIQILLTLWYIPERIFWKKVSRRQQSHKKLPSMQRNKTTDFHHSDLLPSPSEASFSASLHYFEKHCKQFRPRSCPIKCWVWYGSKLMVFLRDLQMTKMHAKLPSMQLGNSVKGCTLAFINTTRTTTHKNKKWAKLTYPRR